MRRDDVPLDVRHVRLVRDVVRDPMGIFFHEQHTATTGFRDSEMRCLDVCPLVVFGVYETMPGQNRERMLGVVDLADYH